MYGIFLYLKIITVLMSESSVKLIYGEKNVRLEESGLFRKVDKMTLLII